jgi:hypothetical protein
VPDARRCTSCEISRLEVAGVWLLTRDWVTKCRDLLPLHASGYLPYLQAKGENNLMSDNIVSPGGTIGTAAKGPKTIEFKVIQASIEKQDGKYSLRHLRYTGDDPTIGERVEQLLKQIVNEKNAEPPKCPHRTDCGREHC